MDRAELIESIATTLSPDGVEFFVSSDSVHEKRFGYKARYIQFARTQTITPTNIPNIPWCAMNDGRIEERFGGEYTQFSDAGGRFWLSPMIYIPEEADGDEIEEIISTALAAWEQAMAEEKREETDLVIGALEEEVEAAMAIYLEVLAKMLAAVDEEGERLYSDEEAAEVARFEAGMKLHTSEEPCIYIENGKVVGWDWDPKTIGDEYWDVVSVELHLPEGTLEPDWR